MGAPAILLISHAPSFLPHPSLGPFPHSQVVVSVGLGLDAIGLLMCLWMLVSIVAFDQVPHPSPLSPSTLAGMMT